MEAEFTEEELNAFDGLEPEPELSPINACGVTAEPEQNNLTLYNGNCLEELKKVQDKSVDLIYLDLPYASSFGKCVDCAWDKPIDLEALWKELKRVRKDKTPIFFCCNAKFGYDLIGSNKKEFRYDLIWVKSAPCGFLNARKMPMKKHELIYVFYKNLPFYDLSSHKHKFVKTKPYVDKDNVYGSVIHPTGQKKSFDPPLPVSVVSYEGNKTKEELCYGIQGDHIKERKKGESRYNPPLPTSVVQDCYNQKERLKSGKLKIMKNEYDPVLPTSIIKAEKTQITTAKKSGIKNLYGDQAGGTIGNVHGSNFEPKLPTSVVEVNEKYTYTQDKSDIYATDIRKETRQGKDVGG